MKFKYYSALSLLVFALSSCIKHEVIPAPEQKATLKAYFNGTINNSQVEFTENVNGYKGTANKSQILLPSGQTSSVAYLFNMSSAQSGFNSSIQVGLGSITWDQANSAGPSLTQFNSFCNSHTNPAYSNLSVSGFSVSYKDNNGSVWNSDEASTQTKNVTFTNVSQESDPNGDYSKFTCTFTCTVYNTLNGDSIQIQNAQLKGWFQR